jgi:pimeloyl-ACP methyl ester carboxylesterase
MATFVLVPGSWHGGWCWWKVAPLLRAAGHTVYPVTLTGLGERTHLATPQTGLDTHILDVVNLLAYEELTGVVLVGHSYGGMVITGVADRAAARLRHLVYLDALVPAAGQAAVDLLPGAAQHWRATAAASDGWRFPPADPARWGITAADDLRRLRAHLVGHPLAAMEQPVQLAQPAGAGLPRTYLHCIGKAGPDAFAATAARVRADPTWRYRALPTGHEAMVTMPRELTALLCEAADCSWRRAC